MALVLFHSKAVILLFVVVFSLFVVAPILCGSFVGCLFCGVILGCLSSLEMCKRELVALLFVVQWLSQNTERLRISKGDYWIKQ